MTQPIVDDPFIRTCELTVNVDPTALKSLSSDAKLAVSKSFIVNGNETQDCPFWSTDAATQTVVSYKPEYALNWTVTPPQTLNPTNEALQLGNQFWAPLVPGKSLDLDTFGTFMPTMDVADPSTLQVMNNSYQSPSGAPVYLVIGLVSKRGSTIVSDPVTPCFVDTQPLQLGCVQRTFGVNAKVTFAFITYSNTGPISYEGSSNIGVADFDLVDPHPPVPAANAPPLQMTATFNGNLEWNISTATS